MGTKGMAHQINSIYGGRTRVDTQRARSPDWASEEPGDESLAAPPIDTKPTEPEVGEPRVVDGIARISTGEPTWRVEIFMPQQNNSSLHRDGKVRMMCIRGPLRLSEDQA